LSYFQVNNISVVKKINAVNDILYDSYESETNLMHVMVNGADRVKKLVTRRSNWCLSFRNRIDVQMCKCADVQMCEFLKEKKSCTKEFAHQQSAHFDFPAESPPYAVASSFSFAGLSGQD